jgi:hypothetical protein
MNILLRFVFGGLVAAAAGLIIHRYGLAIGGLFLAFPATFRPAHTGEKHEKQKKKRAGLQGHYPRALSGGAR